MQEGKPNEGKPFFLKKYTYFLFLKEKRGIENASGGGGEFLLLATFLYGCEVSYSIKVEYGLYRYKVGEFRFHVFYSHFKILFYVILACYYIYHAILCYYVCYPTLRYIMLFSFLCHMILCYFVFLYFLFHFILFYAVLFYVILTYIV